MSNTTNEEIVINVTLEEYQAELASGLEADELLSPGQHHFKRGGFLARHGLKPEQVNMRLISMPDELVTRAMFLANLHHQTTVEAWLSRIIQERIELEEAAFKAAKQQLTDMVGNDKIAAFFQTSPLVGVELERDNSPVREITL